eukprot:g29983.t1
MVSDRKVLLIIAYRAQVLRKSASEPLLGLTDVKETTLEAADAVDHIDRCAGEPLSNVKGLFWAWNGGVECSILGEDAVEAEELGIGDRILAGEWVRGGIANVAVGVSGLEIHVGAETVIGYGEVQEGERGGNYAKEIKGSIKLREKPFNWRNYSISCAAAGEKEKGLRKITIMREMVLNKLMELWSD